MAARQAGRYLGEVLSTLANTLNPSLIVLGGSISFAGEHLLPRDRSILRQCRAACISKAPELFRRRQAGTVRS